MPRESYAAVQWRRVGTVQAGTLTANQFCYTDGTDIICDTNAPTLSGGNVGIGTTSPQSTLSVYGGGLAVGTYANTTTVGVGSAVFSGKVGIGTSSPLAGWTLQVVGNSYLNGTAYITNGSRVGNLFMGGYSGSTNTQIRSYSDLDFSPTNNSYFSTGNVGIGSTSPVSSFDLSQKTDALALPSGSSAQRPTAVNGMIRYNTGSSGSIEAYLNGAWQTLLSGSSGAGQAAGSNWQVQYNNAGALAGGSNFVWDNANGRLGIGTTSPSAPLHVVGRIAADETGFNWPIVRFLNKGSTVGEITTAQNGAGMYFAVAGDNTGWAATKFTIAGTGNVGIGTTSPNAKLEVAGTGANTDLRVTRSNVSPDFYSYIKAPAGVSSVAIFGVHNTSDYDGIAVSGSGSAPGYVGIGTATPGSKLQVNGGAAVGYSASTAAPTNGLAVSGQVGIGTTTPASGVQADINGPVKVAGTGSEPCTAAQVGSIRYNPTGNYFELCSYP